MRTIKKIIRKLLSLESSIRLVNYNKSSFIGKMMHYHDFKKWSCRLKFSSEIIFQRELKELKFNI